MGVPFPDTTFGIVCRLRAEDATGFRSALGTLCERYWNPVCGYARAAWAPNDEEARELAQDFFAWLLEAEVLERYAPERGSLRGFLKGLLRNFERNRLRAARRAKRGGDARAVALDEAFEAGQGVADPRAEDPALAFDRAFRSELTSRALARLRERAEREPRHARRWEVLAAYDLVPEAERPTYGALASRLALDEAQVRNALFAAREALREAVREELRDTVSDPESLEEEWRALVGA